MRIRSKAIALCTFLVLPAGARSQLGAPAATSGYEKLRLTRVEAPPLKDSNATQFLAADSKGHLFLLRGDTLEVFRLGADARFDRRLGKLACDSSPDPAYAAAMDPTGSTWAVGSWLEIALCDFDKEQRPPGLDWVVSAVTFSRSGHPLVAVAAMGPTPDPLQPPSKMRVPRVFGLEDGRWQPVAWGPVPRFEEKPENLMPAIKAQTDSLICTGPKNAVWLASWNSYRLQKVSASERPEREIAVGSGEVEWQKQEKTGRTVPRGVVRALVCAPEGVLYLLVSTADGLALDRFDPSINVLERVLLDGATVSSGPITAALGPNELLLGSRVAADGLWRISLENLAAARWKRVTGVRIDGKPAG
jgi:hypothetical protein